MQSTRSGFENLEVWQYARSLCGEIIPVVAAARRRFDYNLGDQLNRAALSTVANVAEGCLRRRPKEFMSFIRIAGGSNAEVRACLHVALDRQYLTAAEFEALAERTNAIGRMLEKLHRALENGLDARQ